MDDFSIRKEINELDYGKVKEAHNIKSLEREMRFTEVYIKHGGEHPYIREAHCLRSQTKDILMPIEKGDLFAGRIDRMSVGIDPERGDGIEAAYFYQAELLNLQLNNKDIGEKSRQDIKYLLNFWKDENTYTRCRAAFPEFVAKGIPSDRYYSDSEISFPMYGLGGPMPDYGKLVKLGIPGLRDEIIEAGKLTKKEGKGISEFFEGMLMALEILSEAATRYASEAAYLSGETSSEKERSNLMRMGKSLLGIAENAPENFHEAIQLMWLYSLIALPRNYGRMDVYLGDFLVNDLKRGTISENEALELTKGLWRLMIARGDNYNNRVIIGGKGRPNTKNADIFSLLAIQAQIEVNDIIPQLSLRWHEGMDKQIWDKAFEAIGSGSTFPMIYNDDVNIEGVKKGFSIPYEDAEQYVPYGCGEYIINHQSIGSPDCAINILKALNVTIQKGLDPQSGTMKELAPGTSTNYDSFEQLQNTFLRQVEYQMRILATAQDIIYTETSKYAAFPLLSMLYDGCLEEGLPLLAGGVKYRGGVVESFGNNSTGDSLFAIKKIVYEDELCTLDELSEYLRNDFEGREDLQRILKRVPKFGNDNIEADEMSVWVNEMVGKAAIDQKNHTGLDSFHIVMINNSDSILHGKMTAASADGRNAGDPLSNGNQPGAGNDTNGITALLNSMGKLDPSTHAGVVHNLKISKDTFATRNNLMKAAIKAYFKSGGTQIMITVTDARELEDAMKNPENYANLMVRVGGYSERFIYLPHDIQVEIVKRTIY